MIGQNIAHYRVTAKLGEGGMGEVYRATDTKLGRDVALKVLPEAFARDAQRMARFQREAQLLASLNHPNIATIHGLEEAGATRALAMELVEGPTLADRIAQGAIPLDEALPIAAQIAEAVEYAHERGIIHRDLKPANVKLTADGKAKVLDFGLAKALADDPAADFTDSPTISMLATRAGIVLGTAAYISPEVARGKPADQRADIWAFGCVLYEMLTARQAFRGDNASEMLAAVIRDDVDWIVLPSGIPPAIRTLLRRCLQKDPRKRLQAIGDARIAIEETLSGVPEAATSELSLPAGAHVPSRQSVWRSALPWGLFAVTAVVLAVLLVMPRTSLPSRYSGELLPGPAIAFDPRISPDGKLVAFQALVDNLTQVAVMNPDSGNWTVLTRDRSHGLVGNVAWSPDSSKIYFDRWLAQPAGIYTVASLGGEPRLVLASAGCPEPLPDGSLLIVRIDENRVPQLYHFWPESGRLQPLGVWANPTPGTPFRVFLGGKEAVFFGTLKAEDYLGSPHLYILDLTTGATRRLAPELNIVQTSQGFPLAVTPDGQSVLTDLIAGDLHQVVSIPRSGAGPVKTLLTLTTTPWSLEAAPDGTLLLDQVARTAEVLRFPPTGGTPEVLASSDSHPRTDWSAQPVTFSDGRILLIAMPGGRATLLVGEPGGNFFPLVDTREQMSPPVTALENDQVALLLGTPPNQTIAIASEREGRILRKLEETRGKTISDLAVSPDGKTLYYVSAGSVWLMPAAGGTPRRICAGDGVGVDPNGKDLIVKLVGETVRLVRVSEALGTQEIHVRSDFTLSPIPSVGNAVRKDGKILIAIAPKDSWFFSLGILDSKSGTLTRIPVTYSGDLWTPSWAADGRVLVTAASMRGRIWRFRPAS